MKTLTAILLAFVVVGPITYLNILLITYLIKRWKAQARINRRLDAIAAIGRPH